MKLLENYLQHLNEVDALQMAITGVGAVIGGGAGIKHAHKMLEAYCQEEYTDDPVRQERCLSLKYSSSGITWDRLKEDLSAEFGAAAGVAAGALATALIAWAHKKYENWYGKANKACGKMKGSQGRLCRQNYKVEAAKAEIQALKFARSKCRKSKDPKLCVQKLNEKIKYLTDKNPSIEYTMKAIKKYKQD